MFDLDFAPYLKSISENKKLIEANSGYVPISVKIEGEVVEGLVVDSCEALLALNTCVNEYTQVLLLGKPGYGKSTVLTHLLHNVVEICLSNKSHPVPVLLKLKDFFTINEENEILTLPKLIIESLDLIDLTEKQVLRLLKDGELFLLLDGLNEIPPNATRKKLKTFREKYPKTRMVFSSREWDTETYLDIKCKLFIQPLTEKQSEDFSSHILGFDNARKMLQSLHRRVRELVYTPLFLWMLCNIYKPEAPLPPTQSELFRQFTEKQYNNHKSLDEDVEPHDKNFFDNRHNVFKAIATLMMDEGLKLDISMAAEKLSHRYFKNKSKEELISWIKDGRNLHLLQCTSGESSIEFPHQLFQEYYAAGWLSQNLNELSDDELRGCYLNFIKWTESIFMLMDLIEKKEQAERIVTLALDIDVTLAAKLSGRVKEEWQDDVFKILSSYLNKREINEYSAINVMTHNKTKYAIKPMIDFLEKNRIVSEFHISQWDWMALFDIILGVECDESLRYVKKIIEMDFLCMPSVVVVLLDVSTYEIKILASNGSNGLTLLFSEKEKPWLLEKYLSKHCINDSVERVKFSERPIIEDQGSLKWMAMRTLWKWKNYNTFIENLSNIYFYRFPDQEYNYLEIFSTKDEQGKNALFELIDFPVFLIKKYPRLSLRNTCENMLMLRRAATRALAHFISEQMVLNKLTSLLNDEDYGVCCIAAEILGGSSEDKSINALLVMVENAILIEGDRDKDKKISDNIYNAKYLFDFAVLSLRKVKSAEVKELLLNLFDTLEDTKKPLCIEALVGIDCKEAIPKFINCLSRDNKYSTVRKAAIQALGVIGSESEVQYLLKILQDDDFSVKQESIISLDRILKGEICEETISLIVESLFLELDAVRGISEAVFKEYKFYQGVANLPLGEQCRNKIYSQECNTNSSQYIKYTQYMNFILVTLEYVAAKYTNHPICLRIISYTLDAVSISKNTETRSLVLNLLGQIPHYKAIEKWLDEAKCNEKYIAEWSGLINKLAQGGSSYPSVYPNAYKYPQEMHCHFTSKNEKNKFNLAIDKLEAFHSKYRHFYGGGINSKRGENTSYASEFCKKENIINLFQELTQKKDNIGYRNRVLGRIFNYCPDYWPKLTEWVSDHAPDLSESLRILQGISDCKHEYIELAFSSLKNNDFPWKDIISDKIEKCPECLPKLKLLSLQKPENIQKFNFPRILQSSQNNCGYYSYEWFEKSKKISTILSGENQLNNDENFGFLSIVRKIHSTLSEYERFPPEAYKGMGEDGVRNYLSASLKACYFKVAIVTRETENRHGKTDILIKKTNGDNVFIAECKIWKGNSELSKAINQLLEYLTRKDNKAVILFFVPTRDVKKIIDKSKHQIKAHDNFIQYYEEFEYSSHGYHCLFKNTAADDSDIDLAILFYHLEEVQQRHNDR